MATLLQMCNLPNEWIAQNNADRYAKKASIEAKQKHRKRMAAYYEREAKRNRGSKQLSMSASRCLVYRNTIADTSVMECGNKVFSICKGERTAKKAKNTFSKEQAGTIGSIIVTKRFSNSRLTCVCKSRVY